ncbi:MAG: hypothetical protein IPO15_11200 [Anaerolineae bacterium]|uniref:hypothetical protein n=1 Tax=Candidatus Amarolinea dominans TaxID=3140696 RepID=UPI00313512B8|nr:hypothetical protein [Anaerolineae bacterium]
MSNSLRLRLPPHTLPPGNAPLVSMFNSLRFRLLLMLAVVVVVTIGIAALVGGWAITNQFELCQHGRHDEHTLFRCGRRCRYACR